MSRELKNRLLVSAEAARQGGFEQTFEAFKELLRELETAEVDAESTMKLVVQSYSH